MDISYFLSVKKLLEDKLTYLNELKNIDDNIEGIFYEMSSQTQIHNVPDINVKKTNYDECIKNAKCFLDEINKIIYANCDHEFIDDIVYIAPDKSENITYCCICEYIK
jgi:hypothetical protein